MSAHGSGCEVEGCARPSKTRGMCGAHAERVRSGRPLAAPIRPVGMPFEQRYEQVESGCWEWLGATNRYGYGTLGSGSAHRISYELHVGPIPEGLHIDHLCRNRKCVNPDHLEAVTQAENTRRGFAPNLVLHRADHCKHGHAFDEQNTYRAPNGTRACRKCHAARERQRRLRDAS